MMLQRELPEDFVIATGVQHSVREFIHMAAAELGLTLRFEGAGLAERGIVKRVAGDKAPALKPGDVVVAGGPRHFRPAEVDTRLGDPARAKVRLGWVPEIRVQDMCAEIVAANLREARRHALLKAHGYAPPMAQEK